LDQVELELQEKFISAAIRLEKKNSRAGYNYFLAVQFSDSEGPAENMNAGRFWELYRESWDNQRLSSWARAANLLQQSRLELEGLRRKFPSGDIFCFSGKNRFYFDTGLFGFVEGVFFTYGQYFQALQASTDLLQARCEYESGNFYQFLLYFKRALPYIPNQENLKDFLGLSVMEAFYPRPYYDLVQEFCNLYSLDEALVYAIMREESHFNPMAESGVGALGLMQIMPATGNYINRLMLKSGAGDRDFVVEKLFDPAVNIRYGTFYLDYLFRKFGFSPEQAIAAYNAGPGSSTKWLKKAESGNMDFFDSIGFAETRRYSLKVLRAKDYYEHIYYNKSN
jgi:soluble lytic murein transglycosylase